MPKTPRPSPYWRRRGLKCRLAGWALFGLGAAVAMLWAASYDRELELGSWETRLPAVPVPWPQGQGRSSTFTPTVQWSTGITNGTLYLFRYKDVPTPPPGANAFPILEFKRLPLLPVIGGLMLTAGAFLVATLRAGNIRIGPPHCDACVYSLAGLEENTKCPECGKGIVTA